MLRNDISELLRLIIALVFSEQLYRFYYANLLPFCLFPATEWGRNLLGNDLVFEYLNCLLSGPIDRTFCSTFTYHVFVLPHQFTLKLMSITIDITRVRRTHHYLPL